ncbi:hypothetical protein FB45DRAFT_1098188 [Roridomyces roridus]|uniref:Uncharacterized protein n=1 Tax=Roridomyces roridus TaxID=1738132 RepID=A0AAD7CDZ5_9AGAR|nr:hypothetical protein FB45DRAFT_1098188 [Roridomyces roridus]
MGIPRFHLGTRVRHDYDLMPLNRYAYRNNTANIPKGWSCNWESWEYNGLVSLFQDDLQDQWGIEAIVEPLAFQLPRHGYHFVFHAGGEYYFHFPAHVNEDYMTTKRFTARFSSHDDFLKRFKAELDAGHWVELPAPDFDKHGFAMLTDEEASAHPEIFSLPTEEMLKRIDDIQANRGSGRS